MTRQAGLGHDREARGFGALRELTGDISVADHAVRLDAAAVPSKGRDGLDQYALDVIIRSGHIPKVIGFGVV